MKQTSSLVSPLPRLLTLLTITVAALTPAAQAGDYSNLVELRIYPIHDGKQSRFLEFFEEHYLESQEVVGMRIWGQFRDLESENQVVWLRGYRNMGERLAGLRQFYTSPVWGETGQEAVSMLSARATHVHFLEPISKEEGFAPSHHRALLASEADTASGVVVAEVFATDGDLRELAERVRTSVATPFEAVGGTTLGLFASSDQENNFPILPYIQDERVVVLFTSFEDRARYESARAAASSAPERLETLVLKPGRRSRLAHRASE